MKRKYPITQEMIDRYGVINGDNDIIHYDHDYAVKRGFRGTLAHGLMVSGYAVDMACEKWGKDFFYNGEIDVRFRGPVIPNDVVEISVDPGELRAVTADGDALVGKIGLRK
ncbi:hypothetical protein GCM10007276_05300 [Agaricicola taiwanensis]|uniref:MaoC-like domain-containing protein n=1 Tax=Agaricicola taiwanensis TaxID=591372 RepID=A0A8J2VL61_9RHOB|nr:MaoC family dehydratase [Agaricicola taiwanensis]GGE31046.1 hypothetical protein GCM10007276_05300 [Agaricicola taiwanensis]